MEGRTMNEQVTVLIEIHAGEGRADDARDGLIHAIKTSAKPGLIASREFEDPSDPGAFFAIQEWESAAAFQAHMHDAAHSGMDEAIQVLRERPRVSVLRTLAR
jgi:quinol monooxygenase YgiN